MEILAELALAHRCTVEEVVAVQAAQDRLVIRLRQVMAELEDQVQLLVILFFTLVEVEVVLILLQEVIIPETFLRAIMVPAAMAVAVQVLGTEILLRELLIVEVLQHFRELLIGVVEVGAERFYWAAKQDSYSALLEG